MAYPCCWAQCPGGYAVADFISTAIASIEATLLDLYQRRYKSISNKDRMMVNAEIATLMDQRKQLLAEQGRADGTRATLRSIDLATAQGAEESE